MLAMTADASLRPSSRSYRPSRSDVPGNGFTAAASRACSCLQPIPGYGCLAMCHRKSGTAFRRCEAVKAKHPKCKDGQCIGCISYPEDDVAEFHFPLN